MDRHIYKMFPLLAPPSFFNSEQLMNPFGEREEREEKMPLVAK